MNLVGWAKITQPKRLGGLGLRPAREANTGMLGKLVWDMHCKSDKLWVQMLSQKYVKGGAFLDTSLTYGSLIWRSILKPKRCYDKVIILELVTGSPCFGTPHGLLLAPYAFRCLQSTFRIHKGRLKTSFQ